MSIGQVLFSFEGRITRSTFWLRGFLPLVALGVVVGIIDAVSGANGAAVMIYQVVLIWPSLALNAKRFHDRNKTGWWNLIALVPILGALWLLVECGFLAGDEGPNQFGTAAA